jgi:hypothetical protein
MEGIILMSAEKIIKRLDAMKSERLPFDSLWQEVADYALPNAADFNRLYGIGQKRRQKLLDTTAEHSLKIFASSLMGFLANPASTWFTISTMDEDINEDQEAKEWLDKAGQITLNAFNEPSAKFYGHLYTCLVQIGAFGSAGMFVQEGIGSKLEFKSVGVRDTYIAEGHNGAVNTVYREFELTVAQLMEKEALRGWKVSSKVREQKDPDKKIKIVHAIQPRVEKTAKIGIEAMDYESVFVEVGTKHILAEEGFEENPLPVGRWERTPVDVYGRAPMEVAIADVKTANIIQKAILMASEQQLNPTIQMPNDGSLGNADFSGQSILFYDPKHNKPEVLHTVGNIAVTRESLMDVQDAIRRALYVDQLQLVGTAQMTATEVLQRQDEKGRLLAPSIGMVQSELVGVVVERAVGILMRNGTIPPAPEILAGKEIKVVYVSPLTRAQRAGEAQAILEFSQSIAGLAEFNPEVLDKVDFDAAVEELHDINNVPARLLRPDSETDTMRTQRQQQQQQQQMLDMAQQGASAAKDASAAGVL